MQIIFVPIIYMISTRFSTISIKLSFLLALVFSNFYAFSQSSLSTFPAPAQRWLAVGDLDVGGTQLTVEALYKRGANGNIQNILSKHLDPSNVNYLLRANNFQMTTSNGFKVVNSSIPVVNNVWYHIAATYDGASIKLYINGCLVADSAHTGTIVTNDFVAAIGTRSASPGTDHFRGSIDELRVWNVVRTQPQILQNMNNLSNPTTQTGLLAYYKFDGDYLNIQGNASFNGIPQGTPTFDVEAPTISVPEITDVDIVNATCFGYADASLSISGVGNQITYSINGTNFYPDSTFGNLQGGNITVYIKSLDGCVITKDTIIGQPAEVPAPSISYNTPLCSGDTLALSIDTLTGATCYWTGPNGFISNSFDTLIPNATSIESGVYSVYLMYNGCYSDTIADTITVNPVYNLVITETICSNEFYSLGNQQLNQPGNYFLNLQTIAGCDSIIDLTLIVNPSYSFTRDTTLCEGETFTYYGQTLSATGVYQFDLQTTLGCDSVIIYDLIVFPIPASPILTNNSPLLCPNDIAIFEVQPVLGGTFAWTGPNNFASELDSFSFAAPVPSIGDYFATVTVNGCESPASQIALDILNIYTLDDFEFPNVFTPNDDNSNDVLELDEYFKTCQEYTMYIFDRWGNLIYTQISGGEPFDGKTANGVNHQDGVYYYKLRYDNGEKNGFFHIVR
jgi:gliding motility-associated-like protein